MIDLLSWVSPRGPGETARLALGAMNFGQRTPEAEALRIVDRALERGVVLFDTANMYGAGASEEILGRALRGRRDRVLIATKVGIGTKPAKNEGLAPQRIRAALDESLSRLGTEWVDLYYLHTPDRSTPLEETLEAMAGLVREQKVRAIGLSNYSAWESLEILRICDENGWPRPVIGQVLYNLMIREVEIEYLRFAERFALHTTVYNPLAAGLLTGRHTGGAPPSGSRFDGNVRYQRRYWTDRGLELASAFVAVAREAGLAPVDVAYRWLAARRGVDSILTGPGSVAHLDDALDALEHGALSRELIGKLDQIHRSFLGTDTHYAR